MRIKDLFKPILKVVCFTELLVVLNPVITQLNIDFGNTDDAANCILRVYSLTGVMLIETKGVEAVSIEALVVLDVSWLPAAGYVLQLTNIKSGIVKNVLFEKVE